MSDLVQPAMRHMSTNLENLQKSGSQQQRPSSEVIAGHYKSPEAEVPLTPLAIDRWFEDLSYYERTLEQMAHAKLDDNFREELKAIEQWFSVLSDPERTTALYSLLQHTTQVQIRFFMTVLQQLAQKDPVALVSHAAGAGPGTSGAAQAAPSPVPKVQPGPIGSPVAVNPSINKNKTSVQTGSAVLDASRRLYDRSSDPTGSGLSRPKTPVDDAIASANWALGPSNPPGLAGVQTRYPLAAGPDRSSGSLLNNGGISGQPYNRPISPRPVSPIFVNPPTAIGSPAASNQRHPGDGWGHVNLGVGSGLKTPGSPSGAYAHSDYSDSYDEFGGEYSESKGKGGHKEKGKIPETVDLELLRDIPGWLRSLRLHKYTTVFEGYTWKDIVKMSEDDLIARGVSALGARRKLLKVFDIIKAECQAKNIPL
ncbi:hypothetical protein HDV05_008425 [Chytridiales sp. JEL 0842]|nr:hypothetical protein HDV05_008425 [Chytridiales sp. JEL 0842]